MHSLRGLQLARQPRAPVLRFALQRRYETTRATAATGASAQTNASPSFVRRYRRGIIWSTLSLALGGLAGTLVSHTLAPPPHPLPGSREDSILVQDLQTRIDEEFKVKVLRGKCTAAAANLRGEDGAWRELPTGSAGGSFVKDALSGARGLGVERVFWNEKAKELVAVVWFGGAMSGWPGVAHGGGIATVLGEKMALAARLAKGGQPAESAAAGIMETEQFDLAYKSPTYANAFYVVRAFPRYRPDYDSSASADEDIEVDGMLETLQGKLCVEMRGIVPASAIEAHAGGPSPPKASKQWIGWPSRSQA